MARGDQIYVFQKFLNLEGVYQHHGIDCGDGSVIHYRKNTETIERTSLATFALGETKIYVRQYSVCLIPDVVIRRAESRLGERQYNLIFNNCEHFANWCKTGKSESQQVKDFIPVISNMKIEGLYEAIKQALQGAKQDDTTQLLNQALSDLRVVWDEIQPKYKQELKEINVWQQVAIQALKNNREDLARAALMRKRNYEKSATDKKAKLDQLAKMTETLIRNRMNWQQT
ncbi:MULTISPECIES: lecithin retinol acyltransferase family protein [Moorena]|uniref:Phage shock protein A/IM30, suppressor of sigma54-dependent transcription n=1 Tax=Moorena producens 3L TaxID=489825 RepID=F4XMQ9_9CYAN|nr:MULTISPECIES: lecithin retinol acyltransferase family protein [Moorena]NEQ17346.1 NC domain-containing protein [Moorena sp. SIO3E2]NES80278.1 NC domain-containing protein [Moorena sp. SIO2B7]EGJ33968.1 phage shock protein A/IM30, suppressor of sigma54-dependent transcription [Moorena producens 3L]NEP29989.1 NC domain-containing protein [Moorena sp. SIO3B2]NEP65450.1 NC domain-containing protein [Moorena sp. SIO3A5]